MMMRSPSTGLKLLLFVFCMPLLASAQTPSGPSAPVAAPAYVSPEVHADRSVTLRLRLPHAQQVDAVIEGAVTPMQQESEGLWSVTTAVLPPDIYEYHFAVDGTYMLDPRNTDVRDNLLRVSNNLTIPGTPPMPWEAQAIPHGVVEHHTYTSQIVLGLPYNQSDYFVYTPPGYSAKSRQTYPVLYLLHGFSDAADGWSSVGKANFILDSLIAGGKAKPMIVVMTLGYGNMAVLAGGRTPTLNAQNVDLFEKALIGEILPLIESGYHVSKKRQDRAIAGLSMGGHESLLIGLRHPELFAWIGTFSAGVRESTLAELPKTSAEQAKLRLLWMACGVDDGLLQPNRKAIAMLKAEGLPVTAIETPGHHQWPVWRDNLVHFTPLLFQK